MKFAIYGIFLVAVVTAAPTEDKKTKRGILGAYSVGLDHAPLLAAPAPLISSHAISAPLLHAPLVAPAISHAPLLSAPLYSKTILPAPLAYSAPLLSHAPLAAPLAYSHAPLALSHAPLLGHGIW